MNKKRAIREALTRKFDQNSRVRCWAEIEKSRFGRNDRLPDAEFIKAHFGREQHRRDLEVRGNGLSIHHESQSYSVGDAEFAENCHHVRTLTVRSATRSSRAISLLLAPRLEVNRLHVHVK